MEGEGNFDALLPKSASGGLMNELHVHTKPGDRYSCILGGKDKWRWVSTLLGAA